MDHEILSECPFCESVEVAVVWYSPRPSVSAPFAIVELFRVYCSCCSGFGPAKFSAQEAAAAWNGRDAIQVPIETQKKKKNRLPATGEQTNVVHLKDIKKK